MSGSLSLRNIKPHQAMSNTPHPSDDADLNDALKDWPHPFRAAKSSANPLVRAI